MNASATTGGRLHMTHEQGEIEVGGEPVRYEILTVEVRTQGQVSARGAPGPTGNVIVVVPGHGQTVHGPRRLVAEFASKSRSRIAWCVDPTPTAGGDCTDARAIVGIVRDRLSRLSGAAHPLSGQATIVGWSHGGGEALRAAREDPDLFPQYLGICPVGLVERKPSELVASFMLEATRVVAGDLVRGRRSNVGETLRVGADFCRGLVVDLVRSRSIRCLVDDVCWACCKVPGPDFDYPGEVVLLLGTTDSVIRWHDAFPGCGTPDELATHLPAFQQECFPRSRRLEVCLVDGNHMAPEIGPARFVDPGLVLLDEGREVPT